ncbi:glycosyltransferase [Billgrantia diversa]|uniref:glycosyltransferase n=1 Tax=Halomonas sp. MCCC 1A13316 TaxID=2733487 RepID=UPI0018A4A800|nr:glycosyltransferase [Halomonas sp. MCCC 1A13316]QOR39028.1 glycosyltransferase [Halomonas sp. MCCC 1A13316]
MKRILFVTDHLGGGGAPISIIALSSALAERDCEVSIVSLQDKVWHEPPEGVRIKVLDFQYRSPWQKLRRYRLHARLLDQWLRDQAHEFDLVVANLHYSHQVINRSSLAKRAWLCIRTDPTVALMGSRRPGRFARLRRLYHRRRVLAISRGMLDSLARLGIGPAVSRVIPNIIDAVAIQTAMKESVPYDDYIVYVGRLDKRQKRYDRLFNAYAISGVSQRLLVVGDGEIDEAKKIVDSLGIADRVTFVGQQENPYPYMHHARLLVLASDYEGFGRVIAESLVCGTPVVSTDCPSGPREVLGEGLERCLAPLDDGEALGSRIAEVIENPPVIKSRHYETFKPSAIADQYVQLMLMEGSGSECGGSKP